MQPIIFDDTPHVVIGWSAQKATIGGVQRDAVAGVREWIWKITGGVSDVCYMALDSTKDFVHDFCK